MKKTLVIVIFILLTFSIILFSDRKINSAVQQFIAIYVAGTGTSQVAVKDVSQGANNITSGMLMSGQYGFDGTQWQGMRVTTGGYQTISPQETSVLTLLNAANNTVVGANSSLGFLTSKHSWEILIAGNAPNSISVNLEGSFDGGTTWGILDLCTNTATEMRHIVNKEVNMVKANITALTGVTNTTITVKSIHGGN